MPSNSAESQEQRPPVWIGHVAMYSPTVADTSQFMQTIGMRAVFENKNIAVLEMRGGTHLVVTDDAESDLIRGRFDLMVEDLDRSHAQFTDLGLAPGEIERGSIHDSFDLREPGGSIITVNSSHVGDLPV